MVGAARTEESSVHAKALDTFVIVHATTAFFFALTMLLRPGVFGLFSKQPIIDASLTGDAVRWASPFVFGFSGLAAASLKFGPAERRAVATIFAASFWLATFIGCWVQSNGRWKPVHAANIVLFSSLAVSYSAFLFAFPQSFAARSGRGVRRTYPGSGTY